MRKITTEKLKWRDFFLRYMATSKQWMAVRPEKIEMLFSSSADTITIDGVLIKGGHFELEFESSMYVMFGDMVKLETPAIEIEMSIPTIPAKIGDVIRTGKTEISHKMDVSNPYALTGDGLIMKPYVIQYSVDSTVIANLVGEGLPTTASIPMKFKVVGDFTNADALLIKASPIIEFEPIVDVTLADTRLIKGDESFFIDPNVNLTLADIEEIKINLTLVNGFDSYLVFTNADAIVVKPTQDLEFGSSIDIANYDGLKIEATEEWEMSFACDVQIEVAEFKNVEPEEITIAISPIVDIFDCDGLIMSEVEDLEFDSQMDMSGDNDALTFDLGSDFEMETLANVVLYRYAIVDDYWNTSVNDVFLTDVENFILFKE